VRPLAEHIDRLEFNSITGVAIVVAYWRRRSPGRKRGRPENGRPYEGWKMSKVQFGEAETHCTAGGRAARIVQTRAVRHSLTGPQAVELRGRVTSQEI